MAGTGEPVRNWTDLGLGCQDENTPKQGQDLRCSAG